jgi:hypothetical protein
VQRVVGFDVDLVDGEAELGAQAFQRGARVVAQMTAGAGVEGQGVNGAEVPVVGWRWRGAQAWARKR